ncbi:ATP-dependent zinc metalloprotease FtsH [Paenibacillus larvae]|uniref:ATP-dependent zinc metalloprotease FtsH n=3 Tax=Paenibacillus larvae TaxID=1464 RepID=V9WES4_9BACL|nr:ATP-dependent zinc metalloprotease FtsH [Paenibacillus larvae]AHD07622.1 ATP-dependent zinc metalloprotease FtsH [Paenibacillus larvae subsp. larvae DSM 25430]AQR78888.1 cell division protein FtsH [Paenibacillus larvae subsp. larvae]AQT85194.1 cell division protein FtsH [Paenibacillus larvae subsp. pulvifaciens]AQZ47195.1 cell division protein FtsH [Paenibacillus larvae subsp. pulvifaciens]AVF24051.1 ATP-dependent zinc metalloprotease FtsH [Paenibacillus larvae subsp. larvae]
MNRFIRNTAFYLLIFLVTVGIVHFISNQNDQKDGISYTQFRQELSSKNVESVTLKWDGYTYLVTGKYKNPQSQDKKSFITRAPVDPNLFQMIAESDVKTEEYQKMDGDSGWLTLLTGIVPFVIIFILFFFMLNQAQGGGGKVMNFGKSRARLYNEEKKRVTFQDVAGADEEKQELVEVVEFLKDPRKFSAVGARIPKGVLLNGPPGTGKTLLARAVAGEAGVPFFSISGSDFVEMFVGVGASRVRDLFENAKKNAPCIIFIDEIDAVGRQRGAGLGGGHDEREQTLNQLLVEMDGFGANEGIIIVAATNRPDILDPALLRPGRFDRQITVDRPDVKGREAVLKVHSRNKPIADDVKLDSLARYTTGFTGADLENLLNEAALIAARRNRKDISMSEIEEAFDRVIVGTQKKSRIISEQEKKTVAYHESGHAIVGYYAENADMVHKVTIIPRGRAGGYVMMLPKEGEDRMMNTKSELLDKITGLLAGRVSEELFIGEIATGAYSDFQRATGIARKMVMEFGMSEKLGPMQFGSTQGQVFLGRDIGHEQNYSDAIAYEIDQEMQRITLECYDRAKQILTEHKDKVHLVAQTLLEKEQLDKDEIIQLLEHGKLEEKPDDVKVNIQGQDASRQSKELAKNNEETISAPEESKEANHKEHPEETKDQPAQEENPDIKKDKKDE